MYSPTKYCTHVNHEKRTVRGGAARAGAVQVKFSRTRPAPQRPPQTPARLGSRGRPQTPPPPRVRAVADAAGTDPRRKSGSRAAESRPGVTPLGRGSGSQCPGCARAPGAPGSGLPPFGRDGGPRVAFSPAQLWPPRGAGEGSGTPPTPPGRGSAVCLRGARLPGRRYLPWFRGRRGAGAPQGAR